MHHSAVGMLVLEVQKPVFAILSIHPSTLVRTIYFLVFPLRHSHIFLVRTERILGAEFHLPTIFHATGRAHDVIISVALIEFGALNGRLVFMTIIDYA